MANVMSGFAGLHSRILWTAPIGGIIPCLDV